jgi:hypothetical protein
MVFQDYALYPHMTVAPEHRLRPEAAQDARRRDRAKVDEAAEMLGLVDLSRPQAQTALGRSAPARRDGPGHRARPDVFLFDEPLSNLDAKLRVQMRTEIKLLHAALGRRRLRHARSDRGDDAGRPHRRHACRGHAATGNAPVILGIRPEAITDPEGRGPECPQHPAAVEYGGGNRTGRFRHVRHDDTVWQGLHRADAGRCRCSCRAEISTLP